MNSNNIGQIETVINIKEILWDLLEQWKAVLITALLVMVLVVGAKYAKDMKGYETAQAEKEAKKQSTASVEEQINNVLDSLPEEEHSTVLAMVKQNEWIESEKEYINNSILMNTDPTNQRTLVANYYISTEDDSDSVRSSLTYGYSTYLKDANVVDSIGKAIDPNADSKYIAELISFDDSDKTMHSDSADAVIEVKIVLPESADAGEVEAALTAALQGYSSELGRKISPHSLSLISAGEAYLYNSNAVNNRTNILYSIYNLQNYNKNMQSTLSNGQKAALEAISAIKTAEKTASDIEAGKDETADIEDSKPGFSKKYALLGFVLGVMLYAFAYLMIVITKGCISNAGDAEYYTQSRLLGEVYRKEEHKGRLALLHSALVDKYRYKGKLDEDEQIRKAASALEVTCKHVGTDSISLLGLSGLNETGEKLIKAINDKGIRTVLTDVSKEEDGNYLLSLKNAVFMTDRSCRTADLTDLVGILNEYEVSRLGTIFLGSI